MEQPTQEPSLQEIQVNMEPIIEPRRFSRVKKSTIFGDYLVYLMENDFDIGPKYDPFPF